MSEKAAARKYPTCLDIYGCRELGLSEAKGKFTFALKRMFSYFFSLERKISFEITHYLTVQSSDEIKRIKKELNNELGDIPGLYAYMNEDKIFLYIGKAKKLQSRILSHYKEAFYQPKETDKSRAWPDFFAKNAGNLTVYWIEIQKEEERKIAEQMIEYIKSSKFNEEYPVGLRTIASRKKAGLK
jgi:hypothetical protein